MPDLKSLSRRGLNHLSSSGLSRATSGLSYQSIDVAPTLPVALGGWCGRRAGPHHRGILMGMQIAFRLPTSADIDPPADARGGDRWTVTSEWGEIGTRPLTSPRVGFRLCLCSAWIRTWHVIRPHFLSLYFILIPQQVIGQTFNLPPSFNWEIEGGGVCLCRWNTESSSATRWAECWVVSDEGVSNAVFCVSRLKGACVRLSS